MATSTPVASSTLETSVNALSRLVSVPWHRVHTLKSRYNKSMTIRFLSSSVSFDVSQQSKPQEQPPALFKVFIGDSCDSVKLRILYVASRIAFAGISSYSSPS